MGSHIGNEELESKFSLILGDFLADQRLVILNSLVVGASWPEAITPFIEGPLPQYEGEKLVQLNNLLARVAEVRVGITPTNQNAQTVNQTGSAGGVQNILSSTTAGNNNDSLANQSGNRDSNLHSLANQSGNRIPSGGEHTELSRLGIFPTIPTSLALAPTPNPRDFQLSVIAELGDKRKILALADAIENARALGQHTEVTVSDVISDQVGVAIQLEIMQRIPSGCSLTVLS